MSTVMNCLAPHALIAKGHNEIAAGAKLEKRGSPAMALSAVDGILLDQLPRPGSRLP